MKAFFYIVLFTFTPLFIVAQDRVTFQLFYDFNAKKPLPCEELRQFERFITENQKTKFTKISVETHADSIGSELGNLKKGEQRFTVINEYLNQLFFLPEIIFTNKGSALQKSKDIINEYARKAVISFDFYPTPETISPLVEEHVALSYADQQNLNEITTISEELTPSVDESFKGKSLITSVLFIGNTAKYIGNPVASLNQIFDIHTKSPDLKLVISGHTCCGNKIRLSKKRAKKVFRDLVVLGIPRSKMTYKGYGNQRPLVEEKDEKSQNINRRVEVVFY
jgi:outer membrane protein OmpA-like peptidoglycan-associated protein